MRIVRPKYRARDGSQRVSPCYHVYFTDHINVKRRLMACTDRAASNAWANKLGRLVSLRQADEKPDADVARWVDGLDDDTRAKLCEWRLLDSRAIKTTLSLGDHVRDWLRHLEDRGNTPGHVVQQGRRVRKPLGIVADSVAARCGRSLEATADAAKLDTLRISDIDQTDIEAAIAGFDVSARTRNAYAGALRQLFAWCVTNGRAMSSPVLGLANVRGPAERRRRALTLDEATTLIQTTDQADGDHHKLTGPERATVYLLAVETGLRANEIRQLRAGACRLDVDHPYIVARGAYGKTKDREDRLTISDDLAARLRLQTATKLPDAPAFQMPRRTADMLRADLDAAGIAYETEEGVFDFHSLRVQCASFLVSNGVNVKAMQKRLRHSTSQLTLDVYARLIGDGDEALAAMPRLVGTA